MQRPLLRPHRSRPRGRRRVRHVGDQAPNRPRSTPPGPRPGDGLPGLGIQDPALDGTRAAGTRAETQEERGDAQGVEALAPCTGAMHLRTPPSQDATLRHRPPRSRRIASYSRSIASSKRCRSPPGDSVELVASLMNMMCCRRLAPSGNGSSRTWGRTAWSGRPRGTWKK